MKHCHIIISFHLQNRNPNFSSNPSRHHAGSHHRSATVNHLHPSRWQPCTLRLPPPSFMHETRRRKQTNAATSRSFIPAAASTRASTVLPTASHLNHHRSRTSVPQPRTYNRCTSNERATATPSYLRALFESTATETFCTTASFTHQQLNLAPPPRQPSSSRCHHHH